MCLLNVKTFYRYLFKKKQQHRCRFRRRLTCRSMWRVYDDNENINCHIHIYIYWSDPKLLNYLASSPPSVLLKNGQFVTFKMILDWCFLIVSLRGCVCVRDTNTTTTIATTTVEIGQMSVYVFVYVYSNRRKYRHCQLKYKFLYHIHHYNWPPSPHPLPSYIVSFYQSCVLVEYA